MKMICLVMQLLICGHGLRPESDVTGVRKFHSHLAGLEYFMVETNTERCADHGGKPISSVDACTKAAQALNLSDTSPTVKERAQDDEPRPEGCAVWVDDPDNNGLRVYTGDVSGQGTYFGAHQVCMKAHGLGSVRPDA